MIVGIGTDLCDITRIAGVLARQGERFAERVLGPEELILFRARRARSEARGVAFLATRFAVKEAFSKAIGLGMHQPMSWRACQTLPGSGGAPQIVLSGALKTWFEARGWQALVSLSDEREMASATVLVQRLP
ncbi:holo-ACP synthase [Inhella sp.]|uniref:holo-ACP synthase n=1 Tax=Inhella sp. TaxID=1921806 RepID=UPI0035B4A13E